MHRTPVAIFLKTLRDLRYQVLWYGVGLALIAALDVYIYPSYSDQLADLELPEAMQALIGNADYGTPVGFLSAEFFSWAPILLVVFAIMAGTSLLAGEEAEGTLDLLLAQPIGRGRLLLQKLGGLIMGTALISGVIYVGWMVSVPFVDIDVSYTRLLVATLTLVPLTLVFASLATFCSVLLPSRSLATGIVSAVAVFSFFINYLAALVDVLKPLRHVSVFHYFDGGQVLSGDFDWAGFVLLLALDVVFLTLTLLTFAARDIGVRSGLTWPRWSAALT